MSESKSLVTVRTANYMEAQIIKGRLESEGIPVLLRYESAGLIYGITVDGLGQVKVMVPKHLAEEASEILRQGEEGESKNAKYKDEF
ncbi:putative signal transducing protein [Chloroflexota bacterium]